VLDSDFILKVSQAVINKLFDNKNDLGIHTHMISDAFIPLIKQGIITNKYKKNDVASQIII
jgi:acyl-CoA hydrolase